MLKRLKDLFIPHEGNGFRPDFLERFSVGIMLVLILLSFTMANLQALLWISSEWLVSSILPSVIVDLTNTERTTGNLGTLHRSVLLDKAATEKAEDMAKNEYFAHYSPTGVSPWYWFDQVAYDYLHAGENLAVHFTDSSDVVKAWMNSPLHRANIMNGDYYDIGVGTAKGTYQGQPTIYVVQLFGTMRAAPTAVEVAGATTGEITKEISIEKVTATKPATSPEAVVAPATIETAPLSEPAALPEAPTDVVSVYSDLATSSREGVPATISQNNDIHSSETVPLTLRTTTEPSLWLSAVYALLAAIVLFALMFSIRLEWRSHHPVQVAYAGGLLVVMALLLYIHTALTGMVTIM